LFSSSRIGVLALQGDYAAHALVLKGLGATVVELRTLKDFQTKLDGLLIPGGESTVMQLGIEREGIAERVQSTVKSGIPVFATCAGLVMLSREHLNVLDVSCERNAFGRQSKSFEADLMIKGVAGGEFRAVFIRAPIVSDYGSSVDVLAKVEGKVVAVRQGSIFALAFHPELTDDNRLHSEFLSLCKEL